METRPGQRPLPSRLPRRLPRLRGNGATAALTLALLAGSCAVNPVTGKREFTLVGEAQEIELGKGAAEEVAQTVGLYDNPTLQRYVSQLGLAAAAKSERPNLPWQFQVVDDPAVNAFALPGGFIFVTRGLMTHLTSEAQLMSVVGHEIGHVTAKHSVKQLSKAQVAQLGVAVGSIFSETLGQLGTAGLGLLFLKYGRDAERQADDLGFKYTVETGYEVREMPEVFATLKRVSEAAGAERLPGWMSTHPEPDERIARIQQEIAAQNPPRGKQDRDPYLAMTDGLVYGSNPRQGYFDNGVFKHPDLKFQFKPPAGWKGANLSQAVVAEAPGGNAGLQLTVTKEPPAQALDKFAANAAVSAVERVQLPAHGLDASSARFQAKTEQGQLAGLVTFVSYQGKTFQLLGLAPQEAFAAQEPVLKEALASFGPLTDSAALAVQPARIKIVTAPSAMTFAELASRHLSPGVTVDKLALVNQMEPGTRLQAGQKVKVIEGTVRSSSSGNVATR
jgi:predicted Zn-dependent protease